jgi:hypothetical protein
MAAVLISNRRIPIENISEIVDARGKRVLELGGNGRLLLTRQSVELLPPLDDRAMCLQEGLLTPLRRRFVAEAGERLQEPRDARAAMPGFDDQGPDVGNVPIDRLG